MVIGGIDLETLPSVLAIPAAEYAGEADPLLRLWQICDLSELTLRVVVALAIADARRSGGGTLDPRRKADIGSRIEQPTLGKWRGMALALANSPPRDPCVPALYRFVTDQLDPLLAGAASRPTVDSSVLELRNRLAHGGGMSRGMAARLVAVHAPRFEAMFGALGWLAELAFVVPSAGGRMIGPTRALAPLDPGPLDAGAVDDGEVSDPAGAVFAVAGDVRLSLWPLLQYGVPLAADPQRAATRPVPQIFARRGEVRLMMTPIGSDEVAMAEAGDDALAALLALVEREVKVKERFAVPGFAAELRRDASHLVGRGAELARLTEAAAGPAGVAWLTGPAGIGKSYLMARLASDLAEATDDDRARAGSHEDKPEPDDDDRLLLAFRFKLGDARCSRDSFLHFAIERLESWCEVAPAGGRRAPLRWLGQLLDRVPDGRRVIFLLDGLDEVAAIDSQFAEEVVLGLADRARWICAGRSERGLAELFSADRVRHVFPEGLPGLDAVDVRAMLLDKVGPLSKRLLAAERDQGEVATSPFVDRVVASAGGLPIYVAYVIGDVLAGRISDFDTDVILPPSLEAYHGELLKGCGVGSLHQVLTPLVATLAVSREPLSAATLHALLARRALTTWDGDGRALIDRAVAAAAAMLRRAGARGEAVYTLFHLSLRDYLLESPATRIAVTTARLALGDAAVDFRRDPADAATRYLLGHGLAHLVEAGRGEQAAGLLGSFDYLMARTDHDGSPHDGSPGIARLIADFARVGETAAGAAIAEVASFVSRCAHLLVRGGAIALLQSAVAEADRAPITQAAEGWLVGHPPTARWWRRLDRPERPMEDPCLRTFEGHAAGITDVAVHPGGRWAISAAGDASLKVWDLDSGECLRTLQEQKDSMSFAMVTAVPAASALRELGGHGWTVWSVTLLGDGRRAVAAHGDCTLKVWDTDSGACLSTMTGHQGYVWAVVGHPDGARVVSGGDDGTVRVWEVASGRCMDTLRGHEGWVAAVAVLPDGRGIVSVGGDGMVRLWDLATGKLWQTLAGHRDYIAALALAPDGRRAYTGSGDGTVGSWDLLEGRCLARWPAHPEGVWSVAVTGDGRLLSAGRDGVIHLWDPTTGDKLNTLRGHARWVWKVAMVDGERALSASQDKSLKLWRFATPPSARGRAAHHGAITDLAIAGSGSAVSAGQDATLKLWQLAAGRSLRSLYGHDGEVRAVAVTGDGARAVSAGSDATLRVWNLDSGECEQVVAGAGDATALRLGPDGRHALVADREGKLRLFDLEGGVCQETLVQHQGAVWSIATDPGFTRALTAGADAVIHCWDLARRTVYRTLRGHSWEVQAVVLHPDGRRAITASRDKSIKVWELGSGRCLETLNRHSGTSRALAIDRAGRVLSTPDDKTLELWSPEDGEVIARWTADAGIAAIAVTAEGRVVLGDVAGRTTYLELIEP